MAKATPPIPVLVDTREQDPLPLPADRFTVIRVGLDTGDYSLPGLQRVFTIERKSVGDLVNTVIHDWIRFRKELIRMSGMDFAAVVIEADPSDVWAKRYESVAEPAAVFGRLNAAMFDHGVQVVFAGPRPHSTEYVGRLLALAWKKLGGEA